MKVEKENGEPFLPYVLNATPLVYAILCEQLEIVMYLILHMNASFNVAVNGVRLLFIGIRSTLQLLCQTMKSC